MLIKSSNNVPGGVSFNYRISHFANVIINHLKYMAGILY